MVRLIPRIIPITISVFFPKKTPKSKIHGIQPIYGILDRFPVFLDKICFISDGVLSGIGESVVIC